MSSSTRSGGTHPRLCFRWYCCGQSLSHAQHCLLPRLLTMGSMVCMLHIRASHVDKAWNSVPMLVLHLPRSGTADPCCRCMVMSQWTHTVVTCQSGMPLPSSAPPPPSAPVPWPACSTAPPQSASEAAVPVPSRPGLVASRLWSSWRCWMAEPGGRKAIPCQ